jgi:membrane protease YdiL (CAAX protease family)
MSNTLPRPARWSPWIWVLIVAGAVPTAWLVSAVGYPLPARSVGRDLALLLLWSVAEEVVFRGGVQPALARWSPLAGSRQVMGISAANALTSMLFCAAHAWSKPTQVTLGLLPISLLLGASMERSGRLWVPVALHAWFNVLLYAFSALGRG